MIRLIVADDHVVLREALCEMLQSKGKYQIVAQATDGQELIDLARSQTADMIIMDVQMPNLDGLNALAKLQNSERKVPVLVLSADEGEKNVRAALKAGANGFIPKNVGIEELEFAISSVLNGNTYLSPSVTTKLMAGSGGDSIGGNNPLAVLTKREIEVLRHLADGRPNREIGKLLHISTRTVDTHRSNILKKLMVKTNAELVKVAISAGLISV